MRRREILTGTDGECVAESIEHEVCSDLDECTSDCNDLIDSCASLVAYCEEAAYASVAANCPKSCNNC